LAKGSYCCCIAAIFENLESAFKNFFQHRARFPRFKSKPDQQSIRYPESCSIRKNGLKLPKLGIVKAKITRPVTGQIKSVTLTKTSTDKFFASILFETDDLNQPASGKISDIDLGLNSLVTVFDGESCYKVDPIKPTRKYAKRLKHRQQSKAAVKVAIEEILDQLPESYPTDAYQRKCEEVYQHVYESYSGAGRSIYNAAA
jgi:putative transposase